MKRKIVVKVSMTRNECRSKALQTVSKIKGLISAAIEGPERDRVVVVGEDIDTVRLLDKLRKKVGDANIVTVQEIKPPVIIKLDQDRVLVCQHGYSPYQPYACHCYVVPRHYYPPHTFM